jgi:hypothetical protein
MRKRPIFHQLVEGFDDFEITPLIIIGSRLAGHFKPASVTPCNCLAQRQCWRFTIADRARGHRID